jgi:site-specific DNA-cytosine methylase
MARQMITVDLFCGAGGAAEGVRQAIVALGGANHRGYAFNHWEVAIRTMEKNHPNLESKPKKAII